MPLFGSSNTDSNTQHHPAATQLETSSYGAGTGPGRTNQMHDPMAAGTGTVGMGEPGMGNSGMVGHGHHDPAGPRAGMHNDPMLSNQQYGAGGAGGNGTAIPPTGNIGNQHQPGGGGGGATAGLGSKSLRAKGIEMEQEARSLKIQSQELAEAERLEQEAGMRRARAVEHGAHPDHRHVGGVPGGAAGVTGTGTGTGGPGPYN